MTSELDTLRAANSRANAIIGQQADEMVGLQWRLDAEQGVRADLVAAIQEVINGCCHPDIAIRRVLVPIQPLRDVLAKAVALDKPLSLPSDASERNSPLKDCS